ncbi:MAG: metal ABC transporter permease [Kineosporiaceae bacterium]
MLEILDYDFMRRALVAAALVGAVAPLVGTFVVQRGLSLVGDGMGHVALAGVAVGLLTSTSPVWTALVAAVAAAVLLEAIRAVGRTGADLALALLFYGGIAGGVVLVSLTPRGGAANLVAYLFGSVTTTTSADLVAFAVLGGVTLLVLALLGRAMYAVTDDEEFARAMGLRVSLVNTVLLVLVAATVVLSMRVVGLLLISALMVLPVASARLMTGSFARTLAVACALGLVVAVGATAASFSTGTPSGATIVLALIAAFGVTALATSLARQVRAWARRRRHAAGGPPGHDSHLHGGPDCTHPVVEHGDHVDYVHDGHRHAPRLTPAGVDYDEH